MMDRLYVVHGPSAESGDGSMPLFYTDSLKSAGSYVRSERRDTIDHAADVVASDAGTSDDAQRLILAFLATDGYSRRAYDLAAKIVGWPTDMVGYSLECVDDVGAFLRSVDFDGEASDTDAILEWLNER